MSALQPTESEKLPQRPKQSGSLGIGRIAGIEIRIHFTWLLAFIFITWTLAAGFFPQQYEDWETTTYWIAGGIASILLFVSVLVHELAHSLVARARGMPVNSIVLFIFGGASQIEEEPEEPGSEFIMALVGPVTSLVLAGVFWGVGQAMAGQGGPVDAIVTYLALINALLGGFNLLPGLPLDGGRLLRSAISYFTGDLKKATNIAAGVGKLLAWGLIALGFFLLIGGNLLGGLWIAFIGWFLSNAASETGRQMTLKETLSGVEVREAMNEAPCVIGPDTKVDEIVHEIFLQGKARAAAICQDGEPVGIVTPSDVKEVPRENWGSTRVREIMTQEPLYSVETTEDLNTAFKMLARNDINQLLVVEGGELRGILSRADIIQYIQLSQELGLSGENKGTLRAEAS
jgi:Zn-dependent protease/CBS domain-containing protein